jgi:hypothetical protein
MSKLKQSSLHMGTLSYFLATLKILDIPYLYFIFNLPIAKGFKQKSISNTILVELTSSFVKFPIQLVTFVRVNRVEHFKPATFLGGFIGASPWSIDPTLLDAWLNDLRKSNPIGYRELVICLIPAFAPGFTHGAAEEDEDDGTKDAGGHTTGHGNHVSETCPNPNAPLLPHPHAHISRPPLASVTVCATPHAMPLDPVTG